MTLCGFVFSAFLVQVSTAAVLNEMTFVTSSGGALETTIDVDAYFFEEENTGTKFWTRVYNPLTTRGDRLSPGPVLKFRRGDTVTVTLNNKLGHETEVATSINSFHYANTTNLHTHGLHISAEIPQDNVMIAIRPQESFTYIYDIPEDHAGGTFWYHAHHHGSTALQVGGGLVGAIIVEDEESDVPPAIFNMEEVVLLIADTPVSALIDDYVCSTGDALYTSPDNVYYPGDEFVLVNGQFKPTGSITQGQWTRLRIIFSGLSNNLDLTMTTNTAQCEWFLLAKDGIYVEGAPRTLGKMVYLAPGNRADVAVQCTGTGEVVLGSSPTSGIVQTVLVSFNVEASSEGPAPALPQFTPYRPDYLADLDKSTNTSTFDLTFARSDNGCTVNGQIWDGVTALGSIETGSVQEWTVSGTTRHPYHLHVNSYQLSGVSDPTGYFQTDDWHDTLSTPADVTVDKFFFAVDSYVTKSVVHCHFLPHEDLGCMGYLQHTGDAGATTGLTGHGMACLGTSTGTAQYYPNCTMVTA